MAEDIVIRIEDLAAMEKEAPAIDPSTAQSSSAAASPSEITMESLFGPDPWWRDPSFIQSLGELGNRIEYPSGVQPTTEDDCPCADYLQTIISLLEDIDASIGLLSLNSQVDNSQDESTQRSALPPGLGIANQLQQAMSMMLASINAAQILNNPVVAGANMTRAAGSAISMTVSTLVAGGTTALLSSLGSMAGPIGTVIGAAAGGAIQTFFTTVSDGIKSFFDYLDRMYAETSMFSSEMIGAQVNRDLRLMGFRMETAQNYGDQFADIYAAQTELIMALERAKLDLFLYFGPSAEKIIRELSVIVGTITAIMEEPAWLSSMSAIQGVLESAFGGNALLAGLRAMFKPIFDLADQIRLQQAEIGQSTLHHAIQTNMFFGWENR